MSRLSSASKTALARLSGEGWVLASGAREPHEAAPPVASRTPAFSNVRRNIEEAYTRTGEPWGSPVFAMLRDVSVLRERRPAVHPVFGRRRRHGADERHRIEEAVVRRLNRSHLASGEGDDRRRLEVRCLVVRTRHG